MTLATTLDVVAESTESAIREAKMSIVFAQCGFPTINKYCPVFKQITHREAKAVPIDSTNLGLT